jgi:uncharacterized membrane protein
MLYKVKSRQLAGLFCFINFIATIIACCVAHFIVLFATEQRRSISIYGASLLLQGKDHRHFKT